MVKEKNYLKVITNKVKKRGGGVDHNANRNVKSGTGRGAGRGNGNLAGVDDRRNLGVDHGSAQRYFIQHI